MFHCVIPPAGLKNDVKEEPTEASENSNESDPQQPSSAANTEGSGEGATCPVSGDKRDLAKEAGGTVIATAEEYRKENSLCKLA